MKFYTILITFLLAASLSVALHAQGIRYQRVNLSMVDSTSNKPVEEAEVTLFYAPADGSPTSRESKITLNDQFESQNLQVGSSITISVKKKGYERWKMTRLVHPELSENIFEIYLMPIAERKSYMIVEGELSWMQGGKKYPAVGEDVRVRCKRGYKTTVSDELGNYRLELENSEYEGMSELHVRAAYASQKFYGQDSTIDSQCDYNEQDFTLERNQFEGLIQVRVRDSLTNLPIDSAYITIIQNKRILAKEFIGPDGNLVTELAFDRSCFSWICEVSAHGYASKRMELSTIDSIAEFALCKHKMSIYGEVAGKLKLVNELRTTNAQYYDEWLYERLIDDVDSPELILPWEQDIYHHYVLRHPQAEKIITILRYKGIDARRYDDKIIAPTAYDLPNARRICEESFCIPVHEYLKNDERKFVVDSVIEVVRHLNHD